MNAMPNEAKREKFRLITAGTVKIEATGPQGTWLGTGFAISDDGLLMTAWHVIMDATSVSARQLALAKKGWSVRARGRACAADVLFSDPDTDVALLKLREPMPNLHPLVLGKSAGVKVGSPVFRVGFDWRPPRVAEGYVFAIKATDDKLHLIGMRDAHVHRIALLHASMPQSEGTSGGPLVDVDDYVVGIVIHGNGVSHLPNCVMAVPIDVAIERCMHDPHVASLLMRRK